MSAVQPVTKRDGRTVSRVALEEMRLMALDRMREGESPAAVAASFGLHRIWAYKVLAPSPGPGPGSRQARLAVAQGDGPRAHSRRDRSNRCSVGSTARTRASTDSILGCGRGRSCAI